MYVSIFCIIDFHLHSFSSSFRSTDLTYMLNSTTAAWHDVENRRMFFVKYAKENGFDPLVGAHWHAQSKQVLLSQKVPLISHSFFPVLF